MKIKILLMLSRFGLITLALFSLGTRPVVADEPIYIVTTTSDLAYIASRVGGSRVRVDGLIRGNEDPHFIEPKPDFIMKMSRADMFVEIGMDLEVGWSPVLINQSRNSRIQKNAPGYCNASSGIRVLERPTTAVDRSMGDIHVYGNPHYWTDPVNASIIARNIRDTLIRIDSGGRSVYQANYNAFFEAMRSLASSEARKFSAYRGLKVAVYHREFSYLANRFGFTIAGSIEEKPGVPPSARYLKEIEERLKSQNVKIILIAPWNNPAYAGEVGRAIGASVIIMPVSVLSEPSIDTYEKAISSMMERIRNAADATRGR